VAISNHPHSFCRKWPGHLHLPRPQKWQP
jgi:hypothetical protein